MLIVINLFNTFELLNLLTFIQYFDDITIVCLFVCLFYLALVERKKSFLFSVQFEL